MSIAGYQSDVRFENIQGEGNIPLENSLGGYGTTTEKDTNEYVVRLRPSLTKAYEAGLPLAVRFHAENTDTATLDIDGQGAMPLKKFDGGELIPLVSGDLKTTLIYNLVFDGDCFQVLTGIPIPAGIAQNRQEVLGIQDENINLNSVFYINNRNTYALINGNQIVAQNIRLRRVGGAGQTGGTGSGGTVLKMPVPDNVGESLAWTTHSSEGNLFFCQLSGFGVLSIEGEFTSELDEVSIHFPVYIAKTPIEFPLNPVF